MKHRFEYGNLTIKNMEMNWGYFGHHEIISNMVFQ